MFSKNKTILIILFTLSFILTIILSQFSNFETYFLKWHLTVTPIGIILGIFNLDFQFSQWFDYLITLKIENQYDSKTIITAISTTIISIIGLLFTKKELNKQMEVRN